MGRQGGSGGGGVVGREGGSPRLNAPPCLLVKPASVWGGQWPANTHNLCYGKYMAANEMRAYLLTISSIRWAPYARRGSLTKDII